MQGKAYGALMQNAKLNPGLLNFLLRLKNRRIEFYIVSHKTEYGHFDKEKIPLRNEAMKWMESKGFFDCKLIGMSEKQIYFADNREEKISIINDLNIDLFIDDLHEVLLDKNLKPEVKKILFSNSTVFESKIDFISNCWTTIGRYVLGDNSDSDINSYLEIANQRKNGEITRIKGGANSEIYKFYYENKPYVLKLYLDDRLDGKSRLNAEKNAYIFFNSNHIDNVANLKKCNEEFGFTIIEYIEGRKIENIYPSDITKALEFISNLYHYRNISLQNTIPYAAQALLSTRALISEVEERRNTLIKESKELENYLKNDFDLIFKEFKNLLPKKELSVSRELMILSPSDFGFHNALRHINGDIFWLDFEYFGWDDPVKLTSDFLWHPGFNIPNDQEEIWLNKCKKLFIKSDKDYEKRFNYFHPIFGLRWALIVLNVYLEKYRLARGINNIKFEEIKGEQLIKSKNILSRLRDYKKFYDK